MASFSAAAFSTSAFSLGAYNFDSSGLQPIRGLGGGGSIDYQVPRRKLSLKERPNDHLEAVISAAELETKARALMDPLRASPRMVRDVAELLKPHQGKNEIDYDAASQDGNLVRSFAAIWRRYDEKRKEQRRDMRAAGEDLSEYDA